MRVLVRIVASGKVQGVGFRATTKHYAEHLGIKGIVRNLPDGSVEIYALAEEATIKKLVHRLNQEFAVDTSNVSIEEIKSHQAYENFRIV